ncbi:MAG: two-component system sensor histidine kinase/response regulator, partial [Myxococcota bacterium]
GSTFTVVLDLPPCDIPPSSAADTLAARRVLLFGLSPQVARVATDALRSLRAIAITAADVPTAVAANVDVALVSVGPLRDNKMTPDALAARLGLTSRAIILCAPMASARDGDRRALLRLPFTRSELHGAVARAASSGPPELATPPKEDVWEPQSTVLVVEDNPINQRVVKHLLRRQGIETILAANGAQGVAVASETAFRLIFMDCQMPEMDGFEATAAIRAGGGPSSEAVIVALTANAMPEDRQRCLDAGMDDYLAKPVDPGSLKAAVERWLRSDARQSG